MAVLRSFLALCGLASIAGAATCPAADVSAVAHTGTPVGQEVKQNNVTLYISKPQTNTTDKAVLYLTDVFGLALVQNKLLADSFARAGYLTVAPDMFNSTPSATDIDQPTNATTTFLATHAENPTDAIIDVAVRYMRETLGVKRIGVTGYCFGGKYAFRYVAAGKGADAAFAAHPSNLLDAEISAIKGPASVAAAETDNTLNAARRTAIETLLKNSGVAYQMSLYGGTSHGFAVRANVADPEQKFAKETAFLQAVRWFDNWL